MTGSQRIPRHVAIIMDGNGRWARSRGLPRVKGHEQGVERIRPIALACAERGVEYLTLYAFSTENWRRPRREVRALLQLLSRAMDRKGEAYLEDNIRLRLVGSGERLDPALQQKVNEAIELNQHNTGLTLCLAFDYGSRAEIVRAARTIASDLDGSEVTEETIEQRLYTAGMPDVDLLIRCGGEVRLSNYLMWQSAYAELYFTEVLWPDLDEAELDRAFGEFSRRNRRYGALDGGGDA